MFRLIKTFKDSQFLKWSSAVKWPKNQLF